MHCDLISFVPHQRAAVLSPSVEWGIALPKPALNIRMHIGLCSEECNTARYRSRSLGIPIYGTLRNVGMRRLSFYRHWFKSKPKNVMYVLDPDTAFQQSSWGLYDCLRLSQT